MLVTGAEDLDQEDLRSRLDDLTDLDIDADGWLCQPKSCPSGQLKTDPVVVATDGCASFLPTAVHTSAPPRVPGQDY